MDQASPNPATKALGSARVASLLRLRRLLRGRITIPPLWRRPSGVDAATARLLDERAALGLDALSGRVDLRRLRGLAAEPYLQGLDVIECRGHRLLDVSALRNVYGSRNPWRLPPATRTRRRLPDTPAGRRQREWLATLDRAGLLRSVS